MLVTGEASPRSVPGIGENVLVTMMTKLVTFGLSLASNVFISRLLGPRGQGIYSATLLVWTLGALIAGFGIGITNVAFAGQPGRKLPELLSNSLWFVLASGLLSGLGIIAIDMDLVPGQIGELTASQVRILLMAVPLGVAVTALGGLMWGLNRLREWNAIFMLLGPFGSLVALITLVGGLGLGVSGAITAWFFGQAAIMLVGGWRLVLNVPLHLRWNPALLRESLWYGIRANLGQLVGTLNFRLDSLLVLYFLGARDVGLYAVAVLVAEWLYFVPTSISAALFPRFASSNAEAATQLGDRALRITSATSLTGVLALAVAAPFILRIFGEAYDVALGTLLVLLPGVGVYALAHITTVYWYGYAHKPHVNLAIAAFSLVVDIIGVFVLVPQFGLLGAGLASTIAYVAAMGINICLYVRHARTTLRSSLLLTGQDMMLLRPFVYQMRGQAGTYFNHALRLLISNLKLLLKISR